MQPHSSNCSCASCRNRCSRQKESTLSFRSTVSVPHLRSSTLSTHTSHVPDSNLRFAFFAFRRYSRHYLVFVISAAGRWWRWTVSGQGHTLSHVSKELGSDFQMKCDIQTMSHCWFLAKLNSGLQRVQHGVKAAVDWLTSYGTYCTSIRNIS